MYEYKATIVNVVDGDTVDAAVELGFGIIIKQRFRIEGIDTPETRTRDLEEKKLGLAAKEFVKDLILNREVILRSNKFGKFRYLADIIVDGESLSSILLRENHAKVYK